MSEKKYVPNGVFLTCDKGATPSTLRVTQQDTDIYDVPLATEADKIPFLNIKPFGFCKAKYSLCVPLPIIWQEPQEGITRGGFRLLTNESTLRCGLSGEIQIHYSQQGANDATWGGNLKKPTEYITDGFDWLHEQSEEQRVQRDSWLPGWMQPAVDVVDWTGDLGLGLVEGAVNGVVGLGETAYQISQDPVGTAEALGGMVQDGWNAGVEGAGNAWDWASEGENWSNAANSAWDWASEGDNWLDAGQGALEAAGDAASWVGENPRQIGNVVGEFIPDAAAAYFSGGTSLAASGARVAGREILEEGAERVVREGLEEMAERGAREIAEEALEEIPEVVVKKNRPRRPSNKNKNIDHSKTVKNPDGSTTYTDLDGNSVTYSLEGYPDFGEYSIETIDDVPGMNGNYRHDSGLANEIAEFDDGTPEGYVWHHVENGRTMQLIPQDVHNHFPHTGGASGLRDGTLP